MSNEPVAISLLKNLAFALSNASWRSALSDAQLPEFSDAIVSLVVSLVCAYDAIDNKEELATVCLNKS